MLVVCDETGTSPDPRAKLKYSKRRLDAEDPATINHHLAANRDANLGGKEELPSAESLAP